MVEIDRKHMTRLLTEAVKVLCRRSLSFCNEIEIEGLVGITIDSKDVILLSFKELFDQEFETTMESRVKKKRGRKPGKVGRPKGSKNKPKKQVLNVSDGDSDEGETFSKTKKIKTEHVEDDDQASDIENLDTSINSDANSVDKTNDSAFEKNDVDDMMMKNDVIFKKFPEDNGEKEGEFSSICASLSPTKSTKSKSRKSKAYEEEDSFDPSGEKWPCLICAKLFNKRYNMQMHIKAVHLEERTMMCQQCGATFKHGTHLKNHMKYKHSNERNYRCDKCDMAFKHSKDLRNHTAYKHSDVRNSLCNICGGAFVDNKGLLRHTRRMHPEVKIEKKETIVAQPLREENADEALHEETTNMSSIDQSQVNLSHQQTPVSLPDNRPQASQGQTLMTALPNISEAANNFMPANSMQSQHMINTAEQQSLSMPAFPLPHPAMYTNTTAESLAMYNALNRYTHDHGAGPS